MIWSTGVSLRKQFERVVGAAQLEYGFEFEEAVRTCVVGAAQLVCGFEFEEAVRAPVVGAAQLEYGFEFEEAVRARVVGATNRSSGFRGSSNTKGFQSGFETQGWSWE
jgi:hypothetical protein